MKNKMGFLEILLALSSVQAVPDRQQVASSPSLNAFYANPGRGRGDACQLAPGSASAVPSFGGQAAMNTSRDSVVAVEVVDKLCSSNFGSASAGQDARRMPTATSGLNLTLILSLSRSITSSLKPFRFRDDAVEQDAAILFAALAKVMAEQMATNQPSCMRRPSFGDVRLC